MAKMIADLPRKIAALAVQLIPGQAPAGERVSTSRIGSPAPARMETLSLTGPGTEQVVAGMHPAIRRWSTQHTVHVTMSSGPDKGKVSARTITQWHQELVRDEQGRPVMVNDNDQSGVLPPVEWLDAWVRVWRVHFDHSAPQTTRPGSPPRTRQHMEQAMLAADPARSPATAAIVAQWREYATRTVLGLDTHNRSDDPLAEEWEIRFGEPSRAEGPVRNVGYLLTWLEEACDTNASISEFAAELRSLSAELTRALGEQPDQQWLGRCPTRITEVDGDSPRPCGAGLWQDPFTGVYVNGFHTGPGQVQCPRCHSVWTQRELLHLALAIRKTWPIDRRRRYHRDEVDAVAAPTCPGCGRQTRIEWRDVTATTDDRRWWRPERVVCPDGCPEAERLI